MFSKMVCHRSSDLDSVVSVVKAVESSSVLFVCWDVLWKCGGRTGMMFIGHVSAVVCLCASDGCSCGKGGVLEIFMVGV